jgi:tetratricopeptide (TPR) repeat protein
MEVEMSNYEFWDELGKIFNAVVAYQEKSVEFNKRFIHPWIRLGNVFDQDDRNKEAVNAYQKAIELDPANAQNWYELGNVYFRMKSYDEAVDAYQKAVDLDPRSGWSYSNLALTLATQGKHIEAVPLYQQSIELIEENRDKAVVWNRLGNVYRKLNEYELALQAFQHADELDSENAGFRDELDEVAEGPTLVEGDGAQPAGVPLQPLQELLAVSGMEESAAVEAEAHAEPAALETPVAEAQPATAEVETVPLEIAEVEAAAAASVEMEPVSADPGPVAVMDEAVEALAEDAAPALQAAEPTPTWVNEAIPTEILDGPEAEGPVSLEDTQKMAAIKTEAAAVTEEPGPVETVETVVVVEETVAAAAPESAETFTETLAVADTATGTVDVIETVQDESAAPAAVAEEVAVVDPEQSYDEIVLTDGAPIEAEAPVEAEPAPVEETVEAAAAESEVPAEAEPVQEEVAAPVMEKPAELLEGYPVPEHGAYDEYLKDNPELMPVPVAESAEQSAEESVAATQEPVAKIDASGDVQIEMDTRNAHVWNELGNVYFNTGAFDDAIAAYTKAIELDRWFAWPYSNLALAYMQKGRFAEAILLYQRSIELFASDKDKAISWNRLGNVYRRLNDYDNAIASYQRADELDPENTTLSLQSRFSLLGTFSMEQKPSYAA